MTLRAVVLVAVVLFILAFWGTIMWLVMHFVMKAW
jgi:hypothetical protein